MQRGRLARPQMRLHSQDGLQTGCRFYRGYIVIRELPYVPHSTAQSEVLRQFLDQRGELLGTHTAVNVLGRISGDTLIPDIVITVPGASNRQGVVDYGHGGTICCYYFGDCNQSNPLGFARSSKFLFGP
ncbi:hypothetical protein O6H91_23G024000 [Diphasiastrum complanatum]|uniref:Uncharacterized protein n=1 Tax=Diphasiastrum complanatum TaxID=34168 RepID=A0ACC2A9C4_DIPCM|nr:hypothetical protein O6H91_23G024000 [Diphasiastrum complanatum]